MDIFDSNHQPPLALVVYVESSVNAVREFLEECSTEYVDPYRMDRHLLSYLEKVCETYYELLDHFHDLCIEMVAIRKYGNLISHNEILRRSWFVSLYIQLVNFAYDQAMISETGVQHLFSMMPGNYI